MQIQGREQEVGVLQKIVASRKAEFVAIFGRRRVGKTYLIRTFFTHEDCHFFYFTGIRKGSLAEHLTEFALEIGDTFYSGMSPQTPDTWMKAFRMLTQAFESRTDDKQIVLFFDELPWMATPRSRLLSALDYYWNRKWSMNGKIKLIVCGSAASWIIKKIIQNKGGLHNRVTQQIPLEPLNLKETKQYLRYRGVMLNEKQVLELYLSIGGIPYYLDGVEKGLSAQQNISQLCFKKGGLLRTEFDRLFSSLFKNHEAYVELVRIIAGKSQGVDRADIVSQAKLTKEGGTLSDRLTDLEKSNFIISYLPVDKARGLIYKVIDEFSLFYLTWMEKNRKTAFIELSDEQYWEEKSSHQAYKIWAGYAFEAVCFKHIDKVRTALNIPAGAEAYSWEFASKKDTDEDGAQIDLYFDRDDGVITICEIKYHTVPFSIDKTYAKKLMNKIEVFQRKTKTQKQIFLAMITVNGLKQTMYSEELVSSIMTLEDFFK